MAKTVEYVIKIKDWGSAALRRISDEFKSTARVATAAATAMSNALITAGKMAAGGIATAFAGLAVTIREAFKVETALAQFEVLLGSAEKAKSVFAELKKFSDVTPFEFKEVAAAGRMLLAFGVDAKSLIKTLNMLGDVAAAVGIPFVELAEIYGKNRVQGKLMAQDVNQLTGRGIPVIEEFAKILHVSQAEVRGMVEAGAVGFPVLEKALANMTAPGAKFAGMMDKLSTTGEGLFSTLLGEWSGALADFGKGLMDLAKDGIQAAITGLQKLRSDGTIEQWAKRTHDALKLVKDTLAAIFSGDTQALSLSFDVLKAGVHDAFLSAINLFSQRAPVIGKLIGTAAEMAMNIVKQKAWKAEATGQALAEMEAMGVKSKWGFRPAANSGVTQEELQAGLEKRVAEILAQREQAVYSGITGANSDAPTLPQTIERMQQYVDARNMGPQPQAPWTAGTKSEASTYQAARPATRQELLDRRKAAMERYRIGSTSPTGGDPQLAATFEAMRKEAEAEIIATSLALRAMIKAAGSVKTVAQNESDKTKKTAKKASGDATDTADPTTTDNGNTDPATKKEDVPVLGPGLQGVDNMAWNMAGRWKDGARLSNTRMARLFRRHLTGSSSKSVGQSFASHLLPSSFYDSTKEGSTSLSQRFAKDLQSSSFYDSKTARKLTSGGSAGRTPEDKTNDYLKSIDDTLKTKLGMGR